MEKRLEKILALLQKEPDDIFLQYAAAMEYLSGGEKERATEILESIRKHSPDYLAVYYQLGKIYEEKGQDNKAKEIFLEGTGVAEKAGDHKTLNELKQALEEFEDW